jgi:hypothetical protein
MLRGHKGLYWFRHNVPTSNVRLLVLPALVCSKGYKRMREGDDPKSLVKVSNGVESSWIAGIRVACPLWDALLPLL